MASGTLACMIDVFIMSSNVVKISDWQNLKILLDIPSEPDEFFGARVLNMSCKSFCLLI